MFVIHVVANIFLNQRIFITHLHWISYINVFYKKEKCILQVYIWIAIVTINPESSLKRKYFTQVVLCCLHLDLCIVLEKNNFLYTTCTAFMLSTVTDYLIINAHRADVLCLAIDSRVNGIEKYCNCDESIKKQIILTSV